MPNFPSVTQILSPYTDFSMVPEHILSRATERGQKIHAICAAILQGLWVPRIEPELAGYIASFQAWKEQFIEEVIFVEHELVDPVYGFIGHPDMIVRAYKEIILVDLKTPVVLQKAWQLQLSAYLHLARKNGHKPNKAGSLRLTPNGAIPKMQWYLDNANDFNIFLGLLNGFRYFHGN